MASEINPKSEAFDAHDGTPRYDEKQGTTEPIDAPKKSWALRNGLTPESFKAHEDYSKGTVELSRDMKPRHLNMIAIGGRLVPFLPLTFCRHCVTPAYCRLPHYYNDAPMAMWFANKLTVLVQVSSLVVVVRFRLVALVR
jgi:hypothetical protein